MITTKQERELLDNEFEIIEDNIPSKCMDCPLNRVCTYAFEKIDGTETSAIGMDKVLCYYEVKHLYSEKRRLFNKWQSFVDSDPKYFLEKMMVNYDLIEKEAINDFTFAKGMQLQYLLMSIYKMKFGEKTVNQNQIVSATVDIQKLLDKVRDE